MSKKVNIHVGTRDDMGKRFVSAWHRLERGGRVRERHVTFPAGRYLDIGPERKLRHSNISFPAAAIQRPAQACS